MEYCKVAHYVTTSMSESMNLVDRRIDNMENQENFYL